MPLAQYFSVERLVIGFVIFPTAKGDSDPFEGKGAHGGMMGFTSRPLLAVVSSGAIR